MNHETASVISEQENYVLRALADVRKLVFYKLGSKHRDSAEDLLQRVFCKIWAWKIRHDKTLEYDDWQRVTKTVVYREISEFFGEKYTKDIVFSQMDTNLREALFETQSFENALAGNTRAEVDSLLYIFWKRAQILTLRQRYAFVLGSEDFLVEFINTGYCGFKELAAYFEVTEEIFANILDFIPLSERQIGELLSAKLKESVTSQQIWEARAKAKARLAGFFKQPTTNE